jgi:hypothetical protein
MFRTSFVAIVLHFVIGMLVLLHWHIRTPISYSAGVTVSVVMPKESAPENNVHISPPFPLCLLLLSK